jgi:hypothetical protein
LATDEEAGAISGRLAERGGAVEAYAVTDEALEDGDRVFVIGSNGGDHREGFALPALQTYHSIPVAALLPALASAPEG